jgi:hypothetical protein
MGAKEDGAADLWIGATKAALLTRTSIPWGKAVVVVSSSLCTAARSVMSAWTASTTCVKDRKRRKKMRERRKMKGRIVTPPSSAIEYCSSRSLSSDLEYVQF